MNKSTVIPLSFIMDFSYLVVFDQHGNVRKRHPFFPLVYLQLPEQWHLLISPFVFYLWHLQFKY